MLAKWACFFFFFLPLVARGGYRTRFCLYPLALSNPLACSTLPFCRRLRHRPVNVKEARGIPRPGSLLLCFFFSFSSLATSYIIVFDNPRLSLKITVHTFQSRSFPQHNDLRHAAYAIIKPKLWCSKHDPFLFYSFHRRRSRLRCMRLARLRQILRATERRIRTSSRASNHPVVPSDLATKPWLLRTSVGRELFQD